jgi:hypothetical protein
MIGQSADDAPRSSRHDGSVESSTAENKHPASEQ